MNNDNKTLAQQPSEGAGRNETLGSPGSQVADYGNPTGGSATSGGVEEQRNATARPDEADDGRHTLGNP